MTTSLLSRAVTRTVAALLLLLALPFGPAPAAPIAASATSAASADDRAAAEVPRRIDERFARPGRVRRFDVAGPGRWQVSDGRLRLEASRRPAARDRVPTALHRRTVRGSDWTLRVDVRAEGRSGDASVLVDRTGPRDHVEVHLDASRRRSGVYAVRAGDRTRIASLGLAARPGVRHRVRVAHEGSTMTVTVRRPGLRRTVVVGVPLLTSSRVGLGSRGGSASFDDLAVVEQRPARATSVATSAQLAAALADARPGDVITMADGTYTTKGLEADLSIGDQRYYGTFVASRSGTAAAPIVLQGSRGAIIDGAPGGDGTSTQYGLYLAGVEHVRVQGITVRNVSKGIVVDRSAHVTIGSVLVEDVGQEGIHLRAGTRHSEVADSVVRRTGLDNASFGEGIYVGSAESNWSTYSDGRPDASDHNRILRNTISQTGAESVDIKEGSSHGVLEGNVFDGGAMSGSFADSWVDVKGNSWLVRGNHGTTALEDGFQVHVILDGWGRDNVFLGNVADVRGPGYGFWVQDGAVGTVVGCDNVVRAAGLGFSTLPTCDARSRQ
ncbi:right-handed parallel beta-helix repeat-containing protein [uncultured Nocardioides sp.]|uniref:right-handed parallel beta-helix repeat-containing protein n=1 Tax=uncultured Nocardioides sp. TaxID=198441 RepID=UPI002627D919|nr:right-handed parallel beta-helix repeat-containing protein [uncultured Nocardioides sp.]